MVDGVPYRWTAGEEGLVVQHEDTPGAVLRVLMHRPWNVPPIMPGEVATLIRQGLEQGWQPTVSGPPFALPPPPTPTWPAPAAPTSAQPTTEADWSAATNPLSMLTQLDPEEDGRPLLLLTVAIFQRIWERLPTVCRTWVRTVERVAEGEEDPDTINSINAFEPVRESLNQQLANLFSGARSDQWLALQIAQLEWNTRYENPVSPEAGAPVAHLVRDIFGNPFREPLLQRSGLSLLIRTMARTIYTEQTFADLPILADALEEAGCASDDVLAHLREPGPHVRGCWALDLILHEKR